LPASRPTPLPRDNHRPVQLASCVSPPARLLPARSVNPPQPEGISSAVLNRPLRLRATVWRISGLHRQSTIQPRFPIDLRLASATDLRLCLPTQPSTLIDCQILREALQSISSSRLQPIFEPSFPVDPLTCVSNRPSSSAFQSACGSRRLPIFQPTFQLTSSLRLLINLPAQPSSSLSAFAPSCFPALPSEPNLRLSSAAAFSGCLPTDSRLAP